MCLKEVGLHAQSMLIILGSIFNMIVCMCVCFGWGGLYDHIMSTSISTLIMIKREKHSLRRIYLTLGRDNYWQESYDLPAPESHSEMEEAAQWIAGKHMLNPSAYCVPQQASHTLSEVASHLQILSLSLPAFASLLLPLTPVQLPFQKLLSLTSSLTSEHPELSTTNLYPVKYFKGTHRHHKPLNSYIININFTYIQSNQTVPTR